MRPQMRAWGFGIRAHQLTTSLLQVHRQLVREFGPDRVWILSDDMAVRRSWPADWQVVRITRRALDGLLLHHESVERPGWQLGDYGVYLWALEAPQLSHYWVLEPDVHFAVPSVADALAPVADVEDDLVVPRLMPAPDDWNWRPRLEAWTDGPVHRCLFPLTRMTPAAVQAAFDLRRRMADAVEELVPFPNDESTVATAVMQAGLPASSLESHLPEGTFDYFATSIKVWTDSLLRRHPDRALIVHSALTLEEYTGWVSRYLNPRHTAEARAGRRARLLPTLHPDDVPVLDAITPELAPRA